MSCEFISSCDPPRLERLGESAEELRGRRASPSLFADPSRGSRTSRAVSRSIGTASSSSSNIHNGLRRGFSVVFRLVVAASLCFLVSHKLSRQSKAARSAPARALFSSNTLQMKQLGKKVRRRSVCNGIISHKSDKESDSKTTPSCLCQIDFYYFFPPCITPQRRISLRHPFFIVMYSESIAKSFCAGSFGMRRTFCEIFGSEC